MYSSSTPETWTRFIDRTAGADTKVLAVPNSTSGSAAVILANSSANNCGYLSMAAYPAYASIHTGVNGSGVRPSELRFSWDGTSENSLKAISAGIYAPGASLPLKKNTAIYQSIYNLGGPNAMQLVNANPLDIDGVCNLGDIRNFLKQGGFTDTQAGYLETVIRPLYGLISALAYSAREKGCA